MPDFSSNTVAEILAACGAGQDAAAKALSDAFGAALEMAVGELKPPTESDQSGKWETPGLLFQFQLEAGTVYGLLPADSGLVPDWCRTADDDTSQKLKALAEQLSQHLLPDSLVPETSRGEFVEVPSTVLSESAAASFLPLTLKAAETGQAGTLWIIWPAESQSVKSESLPEKAESLPEKTRVDQSEPTAETPDLSPHPSEAPDALPDATPAGIPASKPRTIHYTDIEDGIRQLPGFARSLLKVSVPIRATLASTKIPLSRVLELGPGTIIQFKKSCEDPLTLQAGGQEIAEGEAVKIGDKFGLWITAISMPEERFWVMRGGAPARRIK